MTRPRWALRVLGLALLAACAAPRPKAAQAEYDAWVARLDPAVPDAAAAASACRALGRSGRPEAVEPLLKVWDALLERKFHRFGLPPELEAVRAAAAEALGLLGDIKAVPVLRRGLLDEDRTVSARSAEALALLGDAGSAPALARLAEGQDEGLAQTALEALGAVGGAGAEEALRKALDGPRPFLAVTAAYGLGLRSSVVGRLRLEGWLEESAEPTREGILAAHYLAKLGVPSGVPFLAKLAKDGPPDLRLLAVDALGKTGRAEAVEPLAPAAADKEPSTRVLAALALGRLPGKKAETALRALAVDPDPGVAKAAGAALSERGAR
ncbi:HEAT repeat domain-containing protein [bacterium]|nr:MAG: HEAT repeat domain-containing protein [bacterium]